MERSWSYWSLAGVLFFVAFFSLFLEQAGMGIPLERVTSFLLVPGQRSATEWRNILWRVEQYRIFVAHGGEALARMQYELQQEKSQKDQLALLQKENDLLRKELGKKSEEKKAFFQLSGFRENWRIDGGCLDGVTVGAPILFEGNLVGQVAELEHDGAKISTLLDTAWRVPVQVGTGSARGLLETSRGLVEVRELRQEVPTGEVVVTAGIGGLPGGIPIGRTQQTDQKDRVIIEPYFFPEDAPLVETFIAGEETCAQ